MLNKKVKPHMYPVIMVMMNILVINLLRYSIFDIFPLTYQNDK